MGLGSSPRALWVATMESSRDAEGQGAATVPLPALGSRASEQGCVACGLHGAEQMENGDGSISCLKRPPGCGLVKLGTPFLSPSWEGTGGWSGPVSLTVCFLPPRGEIVVEAGHPPWVCGEQRAPDPALEDVHLVPASSCVSSLGTCLLAALCPAQRSPPSPPVHPMTFPLQPGRSQPDVSQRPHSLLQHNTARLPVVRATPRASRMWAVSGVGPAKDMPAVGLAPLPLTVPVPCSSPRARDVRL